MSLEELIPSNHGKSRFYAIAIRSALAFSTLLVGLAIPFFGKEKDFTSLTIKISSIVIFDTQNSCRPCHVTDRIILDNAHCKFKIVSSFSGYAKQIHILQFHI